MALRYIRKRPRSLKSTPASQNQNLWIERPLKKVETFVYLGSTIARQGGTDADVIARIGKATASFIQQKIIRSSKEIKKRTKIRLFYSNVKSVLLYGAETLRQTHHIPAEDEIRR